MRGCSRLRRAAQRPGLREIPASAGERPRGPAAAGPRGRGARWQRAGSGPFPLDGGRRPEHRRRLWPRRGFGAFAGGGGCLSVGDGGGEAAQREPRGGPRRCPQGARGGCAAGPAPAAGAASGGQRRKVAGGFPRCKSESGAEAQAGGQRFFQSKSSPIPARLCSTDPTVNAGHINSYIHQQMHASVGIIRI